jgi:hypothetical protein
MKEIQQRGNLDMNQGRVMEEVRLEVSLKMFIALRAG